MKISTFGEFMNNIEDDEGEHRIYAIFRGDDCLYVGKSNLSIYNRFFDSRGHMPKNVAGRRFGTTPIGRMIVDNLPGSLSWIIKLYTVDDCRQDIIDYVYPYFRVVIDKEWEENKLRYVDDSERALIRKYRPKLNVIHKPR